MEGNGQRRTDEIRKGPWKAEEDAVLITHVKKYGPRDWSSIRSKGLLQRTGKSCRLRWVNKLRPNLKNGCKFSPEEERIVIQMQAQIGNKWAQIATHLPGRTDNDVKNFWSSRRKRLARLNAAHACNNSDSVPTCPPYEMAASTATSTCTCTCPSSAIDNAVYEYDPFQFGAGSQVLGDVAELPTPGSVDVVPKMEDASVFDGLGGDLLFDPKVASNAATFLDDIPDDVFDALDFLPNPYNW